MTPATDAAREARAREIAWKLVIGEKVGGGDGQTYVGRTPTVREIEAALLAFADTEAASQPREGEVERLRDLYAVHEAWPVGKHPRNGAPSEEWEPYYAANRARAELLAAIPALLLTQRPPEQAGAVPAAILWQQRAIDMLQAQKRAWLCGGSDCTDYDHGRDEGFDLAVAVLRGLNPSAPEVRAMLSAAPTPPDAGPGEIPAGMVAWHGGYGPPADWNGREVLTRGGAMMLPDKNVSWCHYGDPRIARDTRMDIPGADNIDWGGSPAMDCIAYTPDAGIGSDGAGERADRFANDEAAKALYNTWSEQPGWVPWVDRGNSTKQERARREVML